MPPVRYLFCDVDGCLSLGRGYAFDLDAASELRALLDPGSLSLVLASGRSQAYLEAVSQLLAIDTPTICENGAGIYDPGTGRYVHTAAVVDIGPVRTALVELTGGRIVFEPCKDFSLSFRLEGALSDPDTGREHAWVAARYALPEALTMTRSNSAIDIGPVGASKGGAAACLARSMGFRLEDAFGFGDSHNDRSFLELVGHSAAPANASAEIRELVDRVSASDELRGLVDFVRHILDRD